VFYDKVFKVACLVHIQFVFPGLPHCRPSRRSSSVVEGDLKTLKVRKKMLNATHNLARSNPGLRVERSISTNDHKPMPELVE